jgi:hypothetical protein
MEKIGGRWRGLSKMTSKLSGEMFRCKRETDALTVFTAA